MSAVKLVWLIHFTVHRVSIFCHWKDAPINMFTVQFSVRSVNRNARGHQLEYALIKLRHTLCTYYMYSIQYILYNIWLSLLLGKGRLFLVGPSNFREKINL